MTLRSRTASTVAVLTLALAATGCGGDDTPAATGSPTSPAASATTPAAVKSTTTTPRPATVAHLNRATFVPAMTTAIAKQKSWRVTGKTAAGGSTIMTMSGVQTSDPVAMSMTMSGPAFDGKTAKIVVVKKTGYLSIPGMTPGGKYLKFTSGMNADLTELVEGGDPTKIYKSFDKSLVAAKFVRGETVAGEKLDRYAVSVNTAKALAAQGKKLPAGLPKTLVYSIWLDTAHLVRQLTFDLKGVSMVLTMTDYNKPVHITAPPASKVVTG